jgi:hypothetical protein
MNQMMNQMMNQTIDGELTATQHNLWTGELIFWLKVLVLRRRRP